MDVSMYVYVCMEISMFDTKSLSSHKKKFTCTHMCTHPPTHPHRHTDHKTQTQTRHQKEHSLDLRPS